LEGERQTKEKLILEFSRGYYYYISINCFLEMNLLFI